MMNLDHLENLLRLGENEFIYKYYQAFKYPSKHKELNVIVTNKRLILLSINRFNLTQIKIDEYPLRMINKFVIEYSQIVLKSKIFLFVGLLIFSLLMLGLLVYSVINFSLLLFIICFNFLGAGIAGQVFALLTRKKQIFLLEVYNKFYNQKVISIASKYYDSPFGNNNYFLAHQDTFQMLNEISIIIDQAKQINTKHNITKEEVVSVPNEQLELVTQ